MNYSNLVTLIATLLIAAIFLGGVFLNLDIKNSKEELYNFQDDIKQLKLEIKRQKIEITTLTNPMYVLNYIEKKKYKPAPLKNVDFIYIEE